MSKLPDWPSLWKMEPMLRPVEYDLPLVPPQQFSRSWCFLNEKGRSISLFGEETAAAICRDIAVRWLAEKNIDCVLTYRKGKWSVGRCDDPTHALYHLSACGHDTPDAALFAACQTVIEHRSHNPQ